MNNCNKQSISTLLILTIATLSCGEVSSVPAANPPAAPVAIEKPTEIIQPVAPVVVKDPDPKTETEPEVKKPGWREKLKEQIRKHLTDGAELLVDAAVVTYIPWGARGPVKKILNKWVESIINILVDRVLDFILDRIKVMKTGSNDISDPEIKEIADEFLQEDLAPMMEDLAEEARVYYEENIDNDPPPPCMGNWCN